MITRAALGSDPSYWYRKFLLVCAVKGGYRLTKIPCYSFAGLVCGSASIKPSERAIPDEFGEPLVNSIGTPPNVPNLLTSDDSTAVKHKRQEEIRMYTLYKTVRGVEEVVGYYDDVMQGAAAIEEDREKFDDVVQYRLKEDCND